jgi:hypothetical protein
MILITLYLSCLLLIYFIWKSIISSETVKVKSDIDDNIYIIRNGKNNSKYLEDSANTLAIINIRIKKLIEHLKIKYDLTDKKNKFMSRLIEKYTPRLLSEAANDNRYTTFTVDKKDMHICLRTRDTYEKLYDINILMYVVLHELAHFVNYDENNNPIIGHGPEFKYIFRILVKESMNIGIYNYMNFVNEPKEYCGIIINTSIV